MANPEDMLCYGRRLLAMRAAALCEVHPLHPCITAHPLGLQIVERLSATVATLSAPK